MSAPTATAVSPGVGRTLRRAVFWIVVAIIALAFVAIAALASGSAARPGVRLGPDDPGPSGAKALVQTLRNHGVTVLTPSSPDDAAADLSAGDATLLLFDPRGALDGEQTRGLIRRAGRAVVVATGSGVHGATATPAGDVGQTRTVPAHCPVPAAQRAGSIEGSGPVFHAAADARGCFPVGDDRSVLVAGPTGRVVTLGWTTVLENRSITAAGNAALAIGLLGHDDTLVWYRPTAEGAGASAGLGALAPPWLTPVVVMLALAALAAAVWRGRRFGPLVAESLPVVVRAGETMEGRARLYARAAARGHALDQLRIGAITRLARATGLSRTAGVDDVIAAVARVTGRDAHRLRGLLLDDVPGNDRDLVDAADRLAALERETIRGVAGAGPDADDGQSTENTRRE